MGCGQVVHVKGLTAGRGFAVKVLAVPRRRTHLVRSAIESRRRGHARSPFEGCSLMVGRPRAGWPLSRSQADDKSYRQPLSDTSSHKIPSIVKVVLPVKAIAMFSNARGRAGGCQSVKPCISA